MEYITLVWKTDEETIQVLQLIKCGYYSKATFNHRRYTTQYVFIQHLSYFTTLVIYYIIEIPCISF